MRAYFSPEAITVTCSCKTYQVTRRNNLFYTALKLSKYEICFDPYFPVFQNILVEIFNQNTGKYGPGNTPYLNTFEILLVKIFHGAFPIYYCFLSYNIIIAAISHNIANDIFEAAYRYFMSAVEILQNHLV